MKRPKKGLTLETNTILATLPPERDIVRQECRCQHCGNTFGVDRHVSANPELYGTWFCPHCGQGHNAPRENPSLKLTEEQYGFIRTIARMTKDGDCHNCLHSGYDPNPNCEEHADPNSDDENKQPFDMESDDAVETVHGIIDWARGVVKGIAAQPRETINDSELATILHGLRMIQCQGRIEGCAAGTCDHFDEADELTNEQIDDLCERLNFDDITVSAREAAKP